MKKKVILISVALAIVVIFIISFTSRKSKSNKEILIELRSEPFEIAVLNSGELDAKNSVPIMGPAGLAAARVRSVKVDFTPAPEEDIYISNRRATPFKEWMDK